MNRLRNNIVFFTVGKILQFLTAAERRRAYRMVFLTLFGALIDVLGLAAMVPVIMAATRPEFVMENAYMRSLHDALGFETHSGFIVFLAVVLLGIFIVKNAVALAIYYAQSRFAYDVATNLARRQYIKYYRRGFLFFRETNSADTINNIINIPHFFASGILISTINFFSEMLVMLIIVVGIATLDVALFIGLVAILLPSGLLIYSSTKNKLYNLGKEQRELFTVTYSKLNQSIFGYVDVKLNNKERFFLDSYVKDHRRLNNIYKIKYLIGLLPTRALEVIAVLGIVIIFAYTHFFAENQAALYAFIAVFAAAAFRVLPSMNRLLAALMGIKNHQYAVEILDEGELPETLEVQEVVPVKFEEKIEFRDVTFQYAGGRHPAVSGLTFSVKKGERIGIVGESGSGKTTLMNILLRFLTESEGGIYVDGKKLEEKDVAGWRQIVGYVQQDVFLMDATLKQNVAFGEKDEEIDEARLKRALAQASLTAFVESLPQGRDTPIGEMGSKLSGGQKQRIGIARCLYWNSQVLVFDEATSALDMETEQAITESIEALSENQTVFLIAHRITTLKGCDRIFEMKDGRLTGVYSYENLIKNKLG